MKLKELLRLRTDGTTGRPPMEILRRLGLPMPEDVLEQFIYDHGLAGHIQAQFSELDLHALSWSVEKRPATELIAASVYPVNRNYFESTRSKTINNHAGQWEKVLAITAVVAWRSTGSWLRPPLFIQGDLAGSRSPLHLIEGHTRTGALWGLVDAGAIKGDSLHEVWLARPLPFAEVKDNGSWRAVLRENRIYFTDWLKNGVEYDSPIHDVGSAILDSQSHDFDTDDLGTVLTLLKDVEDLPDGLTMAEAERIIREAFQEWDRWTMV